MTNRRLDGGDQGGDWEGSSRGAKGRRRVRAGRRIATAAVTITRIGEMRQRSIVVPSPSKPESTNGARSAGVPEWSNVF